MRSEFEKIEWVKERLDHVWWSQGNEYCDTGKHPRANASFLNGALHLFREKHPKIDDLTKRLEKADSLIIQFGDKIDAPLRNALIDAIRGLKDL